MKPKLSKTNNKQAIAAPGSIEAKVKKRTIGKIHQPGENEIRELAEIIYQQRINRGVFGTADGDWLMAEEYLRFSAS